MSNDRVQIPTFSERLPIEIPVAYSYSFKINMNTTL